MSISRPETTLRGPCTVTGRGYWSGKVNTLIFLPAPAGTGVRFFRDDVVGEGVQAVTENCQGMSLRTCLGSGRERFEMIEHVMAALAGLQIDNVHVHCNAQEMPGLDGSSFPLTVALQAVGTVELRSLKATLRINESIRIGTAQQWIAIEPCEHYEIEYRLDYGPDNAIKKSTFRSLVTPQTFCREIAPARTFVTRAEAELLQSRGLAQHVTERDLLVFDAAGPVHNSLRFPDECARHKALDVLGDLAVIGADLRGRVVANRSGHQLNAELAKKLREMHLASLRRRAAA
jgi:UDP-3-O-[3-hydroxymyristoyl] N-acetylglucosamine deacetylase